MPPISPATLLWISLALVAAGGSIAAYYWRRKPKKRQNTGWLITDDRLALLLNVESRLDEWQRFQDLPDHDPRFSWGRRVHDTIEGYKTDVRLANGLAAARQEEILNVLDKLGKRNRELAAQGQRCDELLEQIDDLERNARVDVDGWFVKDYPSA